MLRHIALFSLEPTCTREDVLELVARLEQLVRDCPEIRAGHVFTARDLGDGALAREFSVDNVQADLGLVFDFDSEEQWRAYAEGPQRRRLVSTSMAAMVRHRVSLQTVEW